LQTLESPARSVYTLRLEIFSRRGYMPPQTGVFGPSPRNGIFQMQKPQHGRSEAVFEPYCRTNVYGISFTRFSGSIAEEPSFLLHIFFSEPPCLTPSRAFFGREGYIQLAIMAIIGGAPPTRPTPEMHLFGGMGKKPRHQNGLETVTFRTNAPAGPTKETHRSIYTHHPSRLSHPLRGGLGGRMRLMGEVDTGVASR